MQVRVVVHLRQRLGHRVAHAHLVDVAHVKNFYAHVVHQFFFALVYAANADLAQVFWVQRRKHLAEAANLDQLSGPLAAQAGHRHAVDIAAGREGSGVEVGMRIKPQHPKLLFQAAAMSRHGADRTNAQAMVAAEHDRQMPKL